MKKSTKAFALLALSATAVCSVAALAACGDDSAESKHTWSEWTVTAPTDTQTGTAEKTCQDEGCAEKVTVTLPVLGDSAYTKQETSATCIAEGATSYTYTENGETVTFSVSIPVIAHSYAESWTVSDQPTDSKTGLAVKACKTTGCTAKQELELPVLDDSAYTPTVETQATCKTEGRIKYVYEKEGQTATFYKTVPFADHVYADEWTVVVNPMATTKGLAVKACQTPTCTEKRTLDLPSHTDYTYAKQIVTECDHTHMPLSCVDTITTTYTYENDGETASYDDEQRQTVKGHGCTVSEVALEAEGGEVSAICPECGETISYDYDTGLTLNQSVTTTLENKSYLIKTTAQQNKFTYPVTKQGVFELSFAYLPEVYGAQYLFSPGALKIAGATTDATTTLTSSTGAPSAGLDAEKYLIRYSGSGEDNASPSGSAYILYVRLVLTKADIGKNITFIMVARPCSTASSNVYYQMTMNFTADKTIDYGENVISVPSEGGVEYKYTPDATKKYSIKLPVGHGLSVGLVKSELEVVTLIDTFGSDEEFEVVNFQGTANEEVIFLFDAEEACTVTVEIGEEVDETLVLEVNTPLALKLSHERRDTIQLGDSVVEGDYTITLEKNQKNGRMNFQLFVNDPEEENPYYFYSGVDPAFTITVHLTPGDELVFYCYDVLTDATTNMTITPVTPQDA